MKRRGIVFFLSILSLGLCGVLHAQPPEGFEALFNGKDLNGWKGDMDLWQVERGEIVGSTETKKLKQNSFLYTDRVFGDFELYVKVKLRNHNSGIQFRSEVLPDHALAGYQADVAEQTYFGMLYEERKRGIMDYWKALTPEEQAAINAAAKLDDWNEYLIRCEGDRITMVLNGKTTCDILDPAGAKEGVIGLQLHSGPAMEVRFKDIYIKALKPSKEALAPVEGDLLMPEIDRTRRERLGHVAGQYQLPEGFSIEEVAADELVHSVVNMTFDPEGRPVLAIEGRGIVILHDDDGDGKYERSEDFTRRVRTAHGLYFMGPGDLLAHADGREGAGLYRLTDKDGDEKADDAQLIQASQGGIGEHGPHAILRGVDGYYYIMYGNHAAPARPIDPASPAYDLREDYLLPPYYDPRGHAVNIRAPGGAIHRVSPDFREWRMHVAGFRNAFDFSIDPMGELFTFDSDMEWDVALPWFRPVRVAHLIPGGDYGWRTGSYNWPFYFVDTLPSMDDVGRGSPVGTLIYDHYAYPQRFRGAYVMGDWSRGRIRILFPRRSGATFTGKTVDFVLGEPLNVTDLEVGPDGFIYFSVGGRNTRGGLYRIRYSGPGAARGREDGIYRAITMPQPQSAFSVQALRAIQEEMGEEWGKALANVAQDPRAEAMDRVRALVLMQVYGPQPDADFLRKLAKVSQAEVRAMAVYYLGLYPIAEVRADLVAALKDMDAFVQRRACESLVRAGLNQGTRIFEAGTKRPLDTLVDDLLALMDSEDRFLRYAARLALERVDRNTWIDSVLRRNPKASWATVTGLLAAIHTLRSAEDADEIFVCLEELSREKMDAELLLAYLRVLELGFIRNPADAGFATQATAPIVPRLRGLFPHADWRVTRELQVLLAYMQDEAAIEPMLRHLYSGQSQEEQIHTVYCLRALRRGWTAEQREQLVAWFDAGREMGGGASLEGFIENLWNDTLSLLPENERMAAEQRKEKALQERAARAAALMDQLSREAPVSSELAQMSFQELSEYLEYDPMAYGRYNFANGRNVFIRSRCASCHVFGNIGKGGGPDLSTVVSRFRRSEILEAIMYPSKVISDQYVGVEVETSSLEDYRGMLVAEDDRTLSLISTDGQRVDIPKSDITHRKTATASIMPEGLLNTMSLRDLVDLIGFLERGASDEN